MLRHVFSKSFLIPALALSALMAVPSVSHAQFKQGDWVMTLAGSGVNNNEFNRGSILVEGSVGYFATANIELSLRQGLAIAERPSSTGGETQVAVDYVFNLGAWAPYIGVNGGLAYSNRSSGSSEVGPEVGIRYFVNSTTFVFAQVEWDFTSSHFTGNGAGNNVLGATNKPADQAVIYTLGLGVTLK